MQVVYTRCHENTCMPWKILQIIAQKLTIYETYEQNYPTFFTIFIRILLPNSIISKHNPVKLIALKSTGLTIFLLNLI